MYNSFQNNGSFGPKENSDYSQTFGYQTPEFYQQYEFQNLNNSNFPKIPYQTTQITKNQREIKILESQVEALEKALIERDETIDLLRFSVHKKDEKCVVCLEKERTHILIPCGHFILCKSCVDIFEQKKISNCPFCQTNIQLINRVFY